jgi:hypothetical protein
MFSSNVSGTGYYWTVLYFLIRHCLYQMLIFFSLFPHAFAWKYKLQNTGNWLRIYGYIVQLFLSPVKLTFKTSGFLGNRGIRWKLNLVHSILEYNRMEVNDGRTISKEICQTSKVVWGGPLSLFILSLFTQKARQNMLRSVCRQCNTAFRTGT